MIQLQVLNKILQDKDSSLILLNNLTDRYFSEYKDEFNFIFNHYTKYGVIPDIATFINVFPNFEVIKVEDSSDYLIEELFKDYRTRVLASTFNNVRQLLLEGKTDDAIEIYKKSTDNLVDGTALRCVDITKDTSRYKDYVERTNNFNKYYISTGIPELDAIIGGWDREEELATIIARTNVGKCLAKGTEVMMADGTLKKVENILVGDKVQSLNGVNTVLELHHGISKGWKITPKNGDPFIVSDGHILTLDHVKAKHKNSPKTESLIDISVEDFMRLRRPKSPLNTATHFEGNSTYMLYKPSIEYPTKNLKIDPYILGLWLGDGSKERIELTSIDEELIEEWNRFASSYNYKMTTASDGMSFDLTGGNKNKNQPNKIKEIFKYYNLIDNKHIPLDYLTGDRNQRLYLLAGLLDKDGYLNSYNQFEISQSGNPLLSKQIKQLARGLGFRVNEEKVKNVFYHYVYHHKDKNTDEIRRAQPLVQLIISGDTYLIPTKLKRKQARKREEFKRKDIRNNNPLLTSFSMDRVDYVDYYGFAVDGDHRYLLGDNTITHNSWFIIKFAEAAVKQGLKVGLYSGEMSEKKVGYRFDTLAGNISNGSLTHGNVDVMSAYTQYINELPNKFKGSLKVLTPNMISGPAGVNALRAFVEKEKLDILFVDQYSLLEDDQKAKNPVEKVSNISNDLKNLQVMKRIPIIAVSQMNRNKNDDGSDIIDSMQIAQSDRIGQNSTIIIGLSRDKKDKSLLKMQLVKSRDTNAGQILSYIVDFNRGTMNFIPEAPKESGSEDLKNKYSTPQPKEEDKPFDE